jgi:hypothetical protein
VNSMNSGNWDSTRISTRSGCAAATFRPRPVIRTIFGQRKLPRDNRAEFGQRVIAAIDKHAQNGRHQRLIIGYRHLFFLPVLNRGRLPYQGVDLPVLVSALGSLTWCATWRDPSDSP